MVSGTLLRQPAFRDWALPGDTGPGLQFQGLQIVLQATHRVQPVCVLACVYIYIIYYMYVCTCMYDVPVCVCTMYKVELRCMCVPVCALVREYVIMYMYYSVRGT